MAAGRSVVGFDVIGLETALIKSTQDRPSRVAKCVSGILAQRVEVQAANALDVPRHSLDEVRVSRRGEDGGYSATVVWDREPAGRSPVSPAG
ncbi:hypothetical protein [Pimelobacter simplex]|uniref:hypothetical protein n=1 Tax=Nocardioides simplex TaxID=2045 RepID=UPI001932F41E|nr:hypothetical protein [Pimelobacter simplex]